MLQLGQLRDHTRPPTMYREKDDFVAELLRYEASPTKKWQAELRGDIEASQTGRYAAFPAEPLPLVRGSASLCCLCIG